MRGVLVSIAALALISCAPLSAVKQEALIFVQECPAEGEVPCLPMGFDARTTTDPSEAAHSATWDESTSHATYELRVNGYLVSAGKDSVGQTAILFEASTQDLPEPPLWYSDGFGCKWLGYGTVASLGLDAKGNPILLTNQGPFIMMDSRFRVGCDDCIEAHRSGSDEVDVYASPDWDLSGYKELGRFTLIENGQVHVEFRDRCIRLSKSAQLEWVESKFCDARLSAPVYGTPGEDHCWSMYQSEPTKHSCEELRRKPPVMIIQRGACT